MDKYVNMFGHPMSESYKKKISEEAEERGITFDEMLAIRTSRFSSLEGDFFDKDGKPIPKPYNRKTPD